MKKFVTVNEFNESSELVKTALLDYFRADINERYFISLVGDWKYVECVIVSNKEHQDAVNNVAKKLGNIIPYINFEFLKNFIEEKYNLILNYEFDGTRCFFEGCSYYPENACEVRFCKNIVGEDRTMCLWKLTQEIINGEVEIND